LLKLNDSLKTALDNSPTCIPFNLLIVKRWENTLSIITSEKNSTYVWYRNDQQIGEGIFWSAGPNGEQIPAGFYSVELVAKDGDIFKSCPEYIEYEQYSRASKTSELKNTNNATYDVLGRLVSRKTAHKVLLRKAK
jgi:hypothetical protein